MELHHVLHSPAILGYISAIVDAQIEYDNQQKRIPVVASSKLGPFHLLVDGLYVLGHQFAGLSFIVIKCLHVYLFDGPLQ